MDRTVALYFVASPLQYLAARKIAREFEPGSRQVLVWYKRSVGAIVDASEWDAAAYMPWPRWEPLPGPCGRLRRLRENIRSVARLVGPCATVHIHSAVFDTEAINYFLRALPRACAARVMKARILPDGVISTRRYPLGRVRRLAQHLRRLRRLIAPELDYWCFDGDRIGSDAPFCDRIYVLPGLPHEYPAGRVVQLPPLVDGGVMMRGTGVDTLPDTPRAGPRALVIGQPLGGFGLMSEADVAAVGAEIHAALAGRGFVHVDYKAHPKDRARDLFHPSYVDIAPPAALESYLACHHYDAVVGVRSSALLFARQIYAPATLVESFGWSRIRFKSSAEKDDFERVFRSVGVVLHP